MDLKIGNVFRTKNIRKQGSPESDELPLVYRKDRRKRKQDRRKSVRDGVFVSFSFKNDRRKGGDRRKNKR